MKKIMFWFLTMLSFDTDWLSNIFIRLHFFFKLELKIRTSWLTELIDKSKNSSRSVSSVLICKTDQAYWILILPSPWTIVWKFLWFRRQFTKNLDASKLNLLWYVSSRKCKWIFCHCLLVIIIFSSFFQKCFQSNFV